MSTHRCKNRLPNLAGTRDAKPMHSRGYCVRHRVRTAIACTVIALFCFAGTAAAATWVDLNATIEQHQIEVIPQSKTHTAKADPIDPFAGQSIEFLAIGQDTRDGEDNSTFGGGGSSGLHNADTTMVVQIAADRSWINIVSIPRDSMIDAPSCQTSNGTVPARYNVMFNSVFATAWQQGGDLSSAASCTMNTVNALTGLNLQNFIVVDFSGLRDMIDAIGGVDLCIPTDTKDRYTGLELSRGLQHLNGTQATQYARMRHGTGTDGSDIMRTTRQQYLIKALLGQAMQKNLFTQSGQLYQLAKSALQSLNMSPGLANAATLVGLAMSLKNLDTTNNIFAQTVPVVPDPSNPTARVVWSSTADDVWAKLRKSRALTERDNTTDQTPSTDNSGSSDQSGSSSGSSDTNTDSGSNTTTQTPTIDPNTGLITEANGKLVDPNTGGYVDPDNGTIHDPNTGQYIGIANQYLYATVCAVPAQE